jgi:nucleoside-diphosphate-sugar epimerase
VARATHDRRSTAITADKEVPMSNKKVLVAGASGLVGHAAVQHFAVLPDWEVIGISRRTPADIEGATLLSVDLTDAETCARTVGGLGDVTHVVYAALHEVPGLFPGWTQDDTIARNGMMLKNLFEPLRRVATNLEHVSLLHGTKAYGLHHPSIGRQGVRNPLREREPRREHPNFYFVQEDYLREQQQRGAWAMTVFRPTVIYGDAAGNNMNPIPVIAAYAALLREEGRPLDFPGRDGVQTLREAVDAELVAHALAWAATALAARDETFNLTNGDVFLWDTVWPAIAETLGMEPGAHRPVSLAEELPKRDGQWAALVEAYDLRAPRRLLDFVGYNSLVYTDMVLSGAPAPTIPILNSTINVRQAGFCECIDTEDMFRTWFGRLQQQRILPPRP